MVIYNLPNFCQVPRVILHSTNANIAKAAPNQLGNPSTDILLFHQSTATENINPSKIIIRNPVVDFHPKTFTNNNPNTLTLNIDATQGPLLNVNIKPSIWIATKAAQNPNNMVRVTHHLTSFGVFNVPMMNLTVECTAIPTVAPKVINKKVPANKLLPINEVTLVVPPPVDSAIPKKSM